jgi:hypothetical protein
MDYSINFASAVSPAQLKAAVLAQRPLDAAAVFAGSADAFEEYEGPSPVVLVQTGLRPGSDFDTELSAGQAFADIIGAPSELHLTTVLCQALGTRALIPDGGRAGSVWMLVTEDGWHGRIVLRDDEDGRMVIDHALQPVPAAPEIPVEAPPEWERGWYDDRTIPAAGFSERNARLPPAHDVPRT